MCQELFCQHAADSVKAFQEAAAGTGYVDADIAATGLGAVHRAGIHPDTGLGEEAVAELIDGDAKG